jgi:hypothetical protein
MPDLAGVKPLHEGVPARTRELSRTASVHYSVHAVPYKAAAVVYPLVQDLPLREAGMLHEKRMPAVNAEVFVVAIPCSDECIVMTAKEAC